MEKEFNLGNFRFTAREIGNGYLSDNGYDDYYYESFDDCIQTFAGIEVPKMIISGDRISLPCARWFDVRRILKERLDEEGDGHVYDHIRYEIEIKVKAKFESEDY